MSKRLATKVAGFQPVGHFCTQRHAPITTRCIEAMTLINVKAAKDTLAGESIHLRQGVDLQVSHSPGKSPALVFLHGGMGNRFNLRSQYEFFAQQGREVLAYDLAGHGQSSPYRRYSLGRHRRDLKRLLHRFHINAPILCCHSYGVPIGLEWARRHPVSALVLISGGTHDLAPWWEVPLMKFLAWGGRHLYGLPAIQELTHYLSSPQRNNEVMERFFAECPVPTERHPYQALEIFWGYNFFRRQSQINSSLPVLVISGRKDPTFTYKMGEELAACFPESKHLHLPEAGHLGMAEYPDVVNGAIAELIHEPLAQRSSQGIVRDNLT